MQQNSDCGMLIKLINDSIARISNNELRENGLTLSQLRYLEYLYEQRDVPVYFKDIERHFQVAQPTTVGVIRRLEGKGWVSVQSGEGGGKAKTALLTQRGKRQYESAELRRNEMEKTLLAPLDTEEKTRFGEMLQRVYENLRES